MHCDLAADEGVVVDLHFVEEPVRVALQDFRQMGADIAGGFAKSIHDPAQGCFVDSQHAGQPVLTDTGGVHAQLQIRVDIAIQCHGYALVEIGLSAFCGGRRGWDSETVAIESPNVQRLICQHFVAKGGQEKSQKTSKLPKVSSRARQLLRNRQLLSWRVINQS